MPNQIFKKDISNDALFNLLEEICYKHQNSYYVYNSNSYKKGIYNDLITNFIEFCKPYYHNSKRYKYLEKKLSQNSFSTVIRQICNNNKIKYLSQIKYDKSSYDIIYFIYI